MQQWKAPFEFRWSHTTICGRRPIQPQRNMRRWFTGVSVIKPPTKFVVQIPATLVINLASGNFEPPEMCLQEWVHSVSNTYQGISETAGCEATPSLTMYRFSSMSDPQTSHDKCSGEAPSIQMAFHRRAHLLQKVVDSDDIFVRNGSELSYHLFILSHQWTAFI